MAKIGYIQAQDLTIKKYRVKIDTNSECWGRMHAHVNERRICKWKQKNSVQCTFELFHEIGHIETTKRSMRRAESEYFATCWAIDRFKEFGYQVPEKTMHTYQWYVLYEVARGKRRGGSNYPELHLYKYAGIDKSIEQFKEELTDNEAYWL